jgi:hypothetical protein
MTTIDSGRQPSPRVLKREEKTPVEAQREAEAYRAALAHVDALFVELSLAIRMNELYHRAPSDEAAATWYERRTVHLYRAFALGDLLRADALRGDIDMSPGRKAAREDKAALN